MKRSQRNQKIAGTGNRGGIEFHEVLEGRLEGMIADAETGEPD